jgi:hypothetical protein
MSSSENIIFYGVLNQSSINLTDWFIDGDFISLDLINASGEFECEAFLNVKVAGQERVIDLVSGNTRNWLDTERLFPIPIEFRDSGVQMRLAIISSNNVFVKISVFVTRGVCDETKDLVRTNLTVSTYNAVNINRTQAALSAITIGIAAALPTGGASLLELPVTVLPLLTPVPLPQGVPSLGG